MRVLGVFGSFLAFGLQAFRSLGRGDEAALIYFGFLAIFAVWVVLCSSLTIVVDADAVRWWFGAGWPGGMIDRAIIGSAEEIDVSAWFSMGGIRRTMTRGWMWSVAPGSAVSLQSGESETILGTDDPDGLLAALRDAPSGAPQGDTT